MGAYRLMMPEPRRVVLKTPCIVWVHRSQYGAVPRRGAVEGKGVVRKDVPLTAPSPENWLPRACLPVTSQGQHHEAHAHEAPGRTR